jgi:hypothetical protein
MCARTISCSTLESKLPNRYHTCDLFSVVGSVTMQWTSSVEHSLYSGLYTLKGFEQLTALCKGNDSVAWWVFAGHVDEWVDC